MPTLGLQGQDTPLTSQREKEVPGPLARKVEQQVRCLLGTHLPGQAERDRGGHGPVLS